MYLSPHCIQITIKLTNPTPNEWEKCVNFTSIDDDHTVQITMPIIEQVRKIVNLTSRSCPNRSVMATTWKRIILVTERNYRELKIQSFHQKKKKGVIQGQETSNEVTNQIDRRIWELKIESSSKNKKETNRSSNVHVHETLPMLANTTRLRFLLSEVVMSETFCVRVIFRFVIWKP